MQAALRAATWDFAGYADPDQFALYQALKLTTQITRVYLPQLSLRYTPKEVGELKEQLAALQQAIKKRREQDTTVLDLPAKVERFAQSVVQKPSYVGRWRKLEGALEELQKLGAALPTLEQLAGLTPPDVPLSNRAVRAANAPAAKAEVTPAEVEAELGSAEVREVCTLLSGRVVLLVGGDKRGEAVSRLETAFDCRIRWLETAPHTSLSVLEREVTDEVAVVLLLVRWSSHIYQELAQKCKARGVPLVRVAGGYSPNRIAHDVLEQAKERMETAS